MGVNRIARIFNQTDWRPTHYCKVDFSQFGDEDWREEVMPFVDSGIRCLLWDVFRHGVNPHNTFEPFWDSIPKSEAIGDAENVTWVSRCKHHGGESPVWHEPFCTAYNSISVMVQWAVKLGFKEIYLLGCDGNFTDGRDDHFVPYYQSVDEGYRDRNNRNFLLSHLFIKTNCPVPVYNATRGAINSILPVVNMEDVLNA